MTTLSTGVLLKLLDGMKTGAAYLGPDFVARPELAAAHASPDLARPDLVSVRLDLARPDLVSARTNLAHPDLAGACPELAGSRVCVLLDRTGAKRTGVKDTGVSHGRPVGSGLERSRRGTGAWLARRRQSVGRRC